MKKGKEDTFTLILQLEDIFHLNRVFLAGFDRSDHPRISSMMAYGTIIDYVQLAKIYAEKIEGKKEFTQEVLLDAIRYWEYLHYISPMPKLLALWMRRQIGVPKPKEPEEPKEEET